MSRAVSFSRYGSPEVLEVIDVAEPHADAGQVRVTVRSAGLNPFDVKVRHGVLPKLVLPSRQGSEFAGVIDEVGADAGDWQVGDEVLGWIGRGAQAEHVVVPASSIAPKPAALDWAIAGGVGLVGNTAKRSTASLSLGADDTVLVTGAAGGVGLLSAQLARRTGATVIGTASERHHEFLRGLGVTPVAYGSGMLDRLREAAPQGFTAALDNVGGDSIEAALLLGIPPQRINTIADHDAAEKYGLGSVGGGGKTAEELEELATLVANGELVLPLRASYPLDEVRAAYEDLESGHGLGKIVLTLGD
ncbi:NADP-dependent oxidoreductase [Parafrigoribacterium soli]|uniref:NADP-dependent oxidoreductase n=1 Tax=Parafrigoribacterium soli TaxID=3144663 RepID=UPI0032EF7CC9